MNEYASWHQVAANIAAMIGAISIVLLIFQYHHTIGLRNLGLMHRCMDSFRTWASQENPELSLQYLELLNEELFYFQKRFIEKKVALEWIEGILDYVQVFDRNGGVLNPYGTTKDVQGEPIWKNKKDFFNRVDYFIHTNLFSSFHVPPPSGDSNSKHQKKKRQLAEKLYEHIRKYPY